MTATESRRTYVNLALALGRAEADEQAVEIDPLRVAELLKWHLDQDLDVLIRHYPVEHKDPSKESYCFWCSEDGVTPITILWPCPEIRSVAKALGAEDKL